MATILTLPVKLGGSVWISQEYGAELYSLNNIDYPAGLYRGRYKLADGHNGIDIAAPEGTPIYAPADGTVIYRGDGNQYEGSQGTMGGYDWLGRPNLIIVLRHDGLDTAYLHCSNPYVRQVGAKVKRGDLIGHVGSTGIGNGPHLHWQAMPHPLNYNDGRWGCRNPRNWMTATAASTDTITPIKEDDMSYLDWPQKDRDQLVKDITEGVLTYKHPDKAVSLGKDLYWWVRNPGYNVWRTQLKSVNGKLYQAAAFLINNNTNGWKIPALERLVKKIAEKLLSKADLDAAVAEINANTDAAMADAVIDVDVKINGKEVQ